MAEEVVSSSNDALPVPEQKSSRAADNQEEAPEQNLSRAADNEEEEEEEYDEPPPVPFIGLKELKKWALYRAIMAEFTSTLMFLYIGVMTIVGYLSDEKRIEDPCSGVGLLGIAWAFGGMTFILVYSNTGISGGHINPAVTFGLFLTRKVSLIRAVLYMVAQYLGAICGVGFVKAIYNTHYDHYGGGANVVSAGYSRRDGWLSEILGTFVLVFTILLAKDFKRNAGDFHLVLAPLPIGFAVFMVHLATIPITGAGINPARSFGAAVIYNKEKAWNDLVIFLVGPFTGATIAAICHQVVLRAGAADPSASFVRYTSN